MVQGNPLVLVVDDEPNMCDIVRRILEKERYKVITAPDGETALKLAEENKPDVILLDIMLPGIDGREVCRRVREVFPATRIIYLTAKVEPDNSLELRELSSEADAFIAKPATSKQILSRVNNVLRYSFQ